MTTRVQQTVSATPVEQAGSPPLPYLFCSTLARIENHPPLKSDPPPITPSLCGCHRILSDRSGSARSRDDLWQRMAPASVPCHGWQQPFWWDTDRTGRSSTRTCVDGRYDAQVGYCDSQRGLADVDREKERHGLLEQTKDWTRTIVHWRMALYDLRTLSLFTDWPRPISTPLASALSRSRTTRWPMPSITLGFQSISFTSASPKDLAFLEGSELSSLAMDLRRPSA